MTVPKMSAGVDDTMNTDLVFHNVLPRGIKAILMGGNHYSGA